MAWMGMLGSPERLRKELDITSVGEARAWVVGIPEDAGRNVTTTANGNHQVGVELLEDLLGRGLTQLVDLLWC